MNLFKACESILAQLELVVSGLDASAYAKPLISLNRSTIGQHIRHTLEFFLCLKSGYESGTVNYDNRKRDPAIESDPQVALRIIEDIRSFIFESPSNRDLKLEGSYDMTGDEPFSIPSNFQRELAYNIEHAVHHMAIIKIGMTETSPGLELPAHFGIAISTVRHTT